MTTTASKPALMGLASGWQTILLPALISIVLLAIVAVLLGFKFPWTYGASSWWTTVLTVIAGVVRGVLALVLVTALSFTTLFAVSSADNTLQRSRHSGQPGFSLPEATFLIPQGYLKRHGLSVGQLRTYLVIGDEVFPSSKTGFLGRTDGTIDPERGVLSGVAAHSNVVVFSNPRLGMNETTAFPYIAQLLQERGVRNLILVGSSLGSQRAERFRSWYEASHWDQFLGPFRAVVYLFPFGNLGQVQHAAVRFAMRAHQLCAGGRLYDWVWKQFLADLVAPENPADQARAEREGWAAQYAAIRGDVTGYPGDVCVNFAQIARGTAFDTGPAYPAYPMYFLSCPAGTDQTLDAAAVRVMLHRMFPGVPESHYRYNLPPGHGMLAERGQQIGEAVDQVDAELEGVS